MTEKPRVLVAIPTYYGKDYVLEEFMTNIANFTYQNYDIMLIDTTPEKGGWFYKKMLKYPKGNARKKTVIPLRRSKTGRQTLAKARNYLRRAFLSEDYDYMFHLESDLLPPKDIIERLMEEEKLIITGMYEIGVEGTNFTLGKGTFWEFDHEGRNPLIHLAFPTPPERLTPEKIARNDTAFTRQLKPHEWETFIDGTVKQVGGCGLGCTLIHRDILERFDFRADIQFSFHDDVLFYADLFNARVPVWLHTGYNILHKNQDWADVSAMPGYKY